MNSLFVINPYKWNGQWVFDDPSRSLDKEALVAGIDTMLDHWVQKLGAGQKGLVLTFSAHFFPGHNFKLRWVREDVVGNWYHSDELGFEGWLCPALFKYFAKAPPEIYAAVKAA